VPEPTPGATVPVRVLIADDNAVIRMGLRLLLAAEPAIDVVGEATNGAEALALARQQLPDVVLLDVNMPGSSGLDVLPELVGFCCVLMLTSSEENETIWTAMQAGARGYLVYGTFDETGIAQSILAAAGGGSVLSPPATQALIAGQHRPPEVREPVLVPPVPPVPGARPEIMARLSAREIAVMEPLVAGRSNTEIAGLLFLAPKTVKNHINRIFTKLQVTTRSQAIALWLGTSDLSVGPGTSPDLGLPKGPETLLRPPPDI
jgi:DNA-binding NarL/FixJ family response regulator